MGRAGRTDRGRRRRAAHLGRLGAAPPGSDRLRGATHPRHDLDEVIHAPVRLSIMAALSGAERIDFRFLRDTIEVSDSLLSKHIVTLENAGYVNVDKAFVGKRAKTWLSLTEQGRAAFARYTDVLRQITEGATRA
ncbi:MarR family transcriptional regulator [Spongiactinospora gelatinilytica]|uniref:MarR family transcriptional regulator n=1 Tax=Spongiactinospora gelatinilytica TaxID=2666298 RepID=A0A2W2FQK5_9ACTN|nr:MarR family transcriptional regulator [Spongiactinospora gelatinilytica]